MAGEWIKMRRDLQRHPKVVRIASALRADRFRVIGGLHAVWSVFDEHSEDGILAGYTFGAMDDAIGWPGFAKAMGAVDWLLFQEHAGLTVPEFDEHNGRSGKRRATEAKRKKHGRDGRFVSASDADIERADCGQKRTTEEEEEEELSSLRKREGAKRAKPPAKPDDVTQQTWDDWLALRKAKKAPVTETVLTGARREAEKAGMPVERFLQIWVMRGSQGLQADWLRADERRPNPADIARTTVPGPTGPDPALEAIKQHRGAPVPPEIRDRIAAITRKPPLQ